MEGLGFTAGCLYVGMSSYCVVRVHNSAVPTPKVPFIVKRSGQAHWTLSELWCVVSDLAIFEIPASIVIGNCGSLVFYMSSYIVEFMGQFHKGLKLPVDYAHYTGPNVLTPYKDV